MPRFAKCLLLSCMLLTGSALSACAGAPFQQMYDARQAVRAAEKAGAAQHAPELLAEAQAHLKTATDNMHVQEYRVARDEAEVAREKAIAARRQAEAAAPRPVRQP